MANKYRSKLEQLTAALLKRNKIKFEYESIKLKYDFPVRGGYCSSCKSGKQVVRRRHYLPDFVLGSNSILEAKGILGSSERSKFLAIKKSNPEWNVAFVFGADNKLSRNSKQRYSDWCRDHGFDFGIKELPRTLAPV